MQKKQTKTSKKSIQSAFDQRIANIKKIITKGEFQYSNYEHLSLNNYFNRITWWAILNVKPKGSFRRIKSNLFSDSKAKEIEDNRIAVVIDHPTPRLLKILKALKDKGLHIEGYYDKYAWDFVQVREQIFSICDSVDVYSCVEHLMHLLIRSNAFIIHYFLKWGNPGRARILLRHKELFAPIVVENYDVLNGMYLSDAECESGVPEKGFADEKYAFEHADGVVFREFSGEYLEKEMGFKMKNQLFFLDYFVMADAIEVANDIDEYNQRKELSFVYAGGILTEREDSCSPVACHIRFGELCAKNRCHYHIYPNIYDEERFVDYIDMDKKCEFFHLHKPVPYSDLGQELSKYDYGVFMVIKERLSIHNTSRYLDNKWIYASTNKYFDYMMAGLPLVAITPQKLTELIEKENMLIPFCVEDFDFELLYKKKIEMKKMVSEKRYVFSMEYQIEKLINFYKHVGRNNNI